MSTDTIRWGILGTADIARKNWLAIKNAGNGIVAGVASRNRKRAEEFIRNCGSSASMPEMPRAFGSYEELVRSEDIDAVYIPLPTGLRKEWVIRAAKAGKHVVCEKPCAPNLSDLEEMVETCRTHRVQFMDGVMFMHSARLPRIREALDSEAIGAFRRITSAFTFCAPTEFYEGNIRADPTLEPQGCLGDLGWYCIRFSLWAMRWQMPRQVTGRVLDKRSVGNKAAPLITEFSGELLFEHGVSAAFFCSFLAHNQEWAHVSGMKGYLKVEDFVVPFDGEESRFEISNHEFVKAGCEFKMEPRGKRATVAEKSQAGPSAQESNLFREFGEQITSGNLNEEWTEWALKTQAVMERCLEAGRKNQPVEWAKAFSVTETKRTGEV